MDKRVVKTILALLTALLVLGVAGVYFLSPRTFRAVTYIVQAWSCHHLAQSFFRCRLEGLAAQYQMLSIKGYENARQNLDGEQLGILIGDEWEALANMYIMRGAYREALDPMTHVEASIKSRMAGGATIDGRTRKALGAVMFNEARILFIEGRYSAAAEKYGEVLENARALIKDQLADKTTDEQVKYSTQELAIVQRTLEITHGEDANIPR